MDHRDEKYRARVQQLSTTLVYCTFDLKVPSPSRRNMHVAFDPDLDDHWVVRPDLASLWYDRVCHDLDPQAEDLDPHRDERWTKMDNVYPLSKWTRSLTHRPYEKRRQYGICGLSYAIRPFISVDRWRSRVDEDCFIITRVPFTLKFRKKFLK